MKKKVILIAALMKKLEDDFGEGYSRRSYNALRANYSDFLICTPKGLGIAAELAEAFLAHYKARSALIEALKEYAAANGIKYRLPYGIDKRSKDFVEAIVRRSYEARKKKPAAPNETTKQKPETKKGTAENDKTSKERSSRK